MDKVIELLNKGRKETVVSAEILRMEIDKTETKLMQDRVELTRLNVLAENLEGAIKLLKGK